MHEPPGVPRGCRAILIAGATATGKSALAQHYAGQTDGLIVNTDAMQVYSCWRILTDRPSATDETRSVHALYGHVGYEVRYSVGAWLKGVRALQDRHPDRTLIFVGGTGLYHSALVRGLAPIPPIDDETREVAEERVAEGGIESLLDDLAIRDPETVGTLDQNNPMRVQRAWEVLQSTGIGLAEWQGKTSVPLVDRGKALALVIECDPVRLADRIGKRLAMMVTAGVLDECQQLQPRWDPDLPASRALGGREFMAHLEGMMSLEEALMLTARSTRHYAKRQRTWFRNQMADWTRIESTARTAGSRS